MADALGRAAGLLAHVLDGGPALAWAPVAPPGLVLGRSAGPEPVDWAACARAGVGVHRRASGGGPVLWDADLVAFDIVLPAGHALLSSDVVASYRWLGEALAEALGALGIDARAVLTDDARALAADRRDTPAAAACYGNLSPFEVVSDGRKLVGLAQVRRRVGALFQVGIPLRPAGAALAELLDLGGASRAAFAADLNGFCPGLSAWIADADGPDVEEAVEATLAGELSVTLVNAKQSDAEEETAATETAGRHAPIIDSSLSDRSGPQRRRRPGERSRGP